MVILFNDLLILDIIKVVLEKLGFIEVILI